MRLQTVKTLASGEKCKIYMSANTIGQGVRGKEENIVEVVWRHNFRGVGMAEFSNGEPVGLPLSDGDIVMMEPINSIKNAFWDAGMSCTVITGDYNGTNSNVKLEVTSYGGCKGDVLTISTIDDTVYDAIAQVELGQLRNYEALVAKINLYYKH